MQITLLTRSVVVIAAGLVCIPSFAQPGRNPKITAIRVDPPKSVFGPHGATINQYGHMGLADEHSTIFPPATFPGQSNYLFFVATPMGDAPEAGLVVLQSISLSDDGQWTLDFDPGYGRGPLFTTAMAKGNCPGLPQDPTFDLNYGAPGTVFLDPTNPSNLGNAGLLMVYEGTTSCIGITTPGPRPDAGSPDEKNHFYSTIGIATSGDAGHTWPVYLANFTPLPDVNQSQGPMSPLGAWDGGVCVGNTCPSATRAPAPAQYGRYAVSGPATSIEEAIALSPGRLAGTTGDSEPAAFVDDVRPGAPTYVYITHMYNHGPFPKDPQISPGVPTDISVSRIRLNGGVERLKAMHWYNNNFSEPGLAADGGGRESAIFQDLDTTIDKYQHCLTPAQRRSGASISYSEATDQYLLVFICLSPSNPQNETQYQTGKLIGGAWFYATIDANGAELATQRWSVPQEIDRSWSDFGSDSCGSTFAGWYPSLMSLDTKPGHLAQDGYVFYMDGCISGRGRTFSSRRFHMDLNAQ